MRNIVRKSACLALVMGALAMAPAAYAGSTIGGNPSNGGGTTFGADAITGSVGGQEVAAALASGSPTAINNAIINAVNATGFNLAGGDNLAPLPGLTGAQTVTVLLGLIQNFAAATGLGPNDSAIILLTAIARTAAA